MTPDPTRQKADFDAIYDQPDPRAYFATLSPLGYAIPQHGADIFDELLRARADLAAPPRLLDVCCSYGVVATLMKTDLRIEDVYEHYRQATSRSLSHEQLVTEDRRLLRDRRRRGGGPYVVGLDVAHNAVRYAEETGALDVGLTENLENDEPSARLTDLLGGIDLITTTGGVGYVTEATFGRLISAAPDSTWVAAFCLRTYDYDAISRTLDKRGLVTERLPGTFRQRRFTGADEQEWAVSAVRERGIDPATKEAEGYYHAELFVSRPAAEVEARPLDELLPDRA